MGYSMIFMMPAAASDADVFLTGCDGSLPGMQVFLCRKARPFYYHGRKWPVRKSKYISKEGLGMAAVLWRILHLDVHRTHRCVHRYQQ